MMTRTKRHKRQAGVVCLDFRPFWDSLRLAVQTISRAMESLSGWADPTLRARMAAGGAGDPHALLGWQCGPCSGWLHDSCRDPAKTRCACTCHGGPLR